MVGAGESYLPAFALSQGLTEVQAGYFVTLPLMMGALIQMITPWGIAQVKSLKKWVVGAASLQAVAFLPLLILSYQDSSPSWVLFLLASVYWGAGFAAGPPWNSWMSQLISPEETSEFFATRLRVSQMGIMAGLFLGGVALHFGAQFEITTLVFSALFIVAFFFRASSALLLSQKDYDHTWHVVSAGFHETIRLFFSEAPYRKFFGFLFVFFSVIFISSPFVNPYFLEKVKLDYFSYMLSLGALFVGKIAVLPFAGKLVEKWGVKRVLFIGAMGISPLPGFWFLSQEVWFLMSLQALSGAFWSIFEVSLALVFFNQVEARFKISTLTIYNLFYALAIAVGSLLGGFLLHQMEESWKGYFTIFVFGAILRCLVVVGFYFMSKKDKNFLWSSKSSKGSAEASKSFL
ncbi:MAG: MFS transporter [Proteobacteria bacterium]|jgi:predicted MFS family arabinose efflux permease|nr:MFS transporter [Pseudomonadota bacterium]